MLFNLHESSDEGELVDGLVNKDPNTEEGVNSIADEVENAMQDSTLEAMSLFAGGEEALKEFCESESGQALLEARKLGKKTYVRIGKTDDLKRRTNLASLILAREHKDPLFNKLALNRVKERKLRNAIYQKYGNKAARIAKMSQVKHQKVMRKMPNFNPFK